ncbi:type IV secretion system protein [uncultured Tateyamaria sp.]|uniref:type IV secretion system protein n=1 Tax=uncultured Tateyamaria sp. TaxID=455651 RepID=UPI00260D6AD8|nr:type IV secretion system protein [uncultured Tateyamaria sp.]
MIGTTAETLYNSTVAQITGFFFVVLTMLIVVLGINMVFGMFKMSMRESMQIIFRIVLVMMFALAWPNLGAIYNATTNGTQALALAYFEPFQGAIGGTATEAMDGYATDSASVVDQAAQATSSFFRALVSLALWIFLGLLVAVYIAVVGASKLWIAALLGFAPFAIMCTVFDKTKNIFEGWLTTIVANLLYPVFCAAIVGTIVTANAEIFGGVDENSNLGNLMAFIVLNVVGIIAISKVPAIAHGITGSFGVASFSPRPLAIPGSALGAFIGSTYVGRKISNHLDKKREQRPSARDRADFEDYGGMKRDEYKRDQDRSRLADRMRQNHARDRFRDEFRRNNKKK